MFSLNKKNKCSANVSSAIVLSQCASGGERVGFQDIFPVVAFCHGHDAGVVTGHMTEAPGTQDTVAGKGLNVGLELLNALTSEKQQIYKLTARHRVPRCELVDLLFLKKS